MLLLVLNPVLALINVVLAIIDVVGSIFRSGSAILEGACHYLSSFIAWASESEGDPAEPPTEGDSTPNTGHDPAESKARTEAGDVYTST
jgi:hypothetical protein